MNIRRRFVVSGIVLAFIAAACGESEPADVATLNPEVSPPASTETGEPSPNAPPTDPSEWATTILGESGVDAGVEATAGPNGVQVVMSSTESGLTAWFDAGGGFEPATIGPATSTVSVSVAAVEAVADGFIAAVNESDSFIPQVWFSTDGSGWTQLDTPGIDRPAEVTSLSSLGEGAVIAGALRVGVQPNTGPFEPVIWRSEDLLAWTEVDLGPRTAGTVSGITATPTAEIGRAHV